MSPSRRSTRSFPARALLAVAITLVVAAGIALPVTLAVPDPGEPALAAAVADHLLISEFATGGTSASDEFVELYNPTAAELALADLELVYVTASGATVTRKATWAPDATGLLPGAHVLVANEAGVFAAMADATYAGGLSATGGSLALRSPGASSAIDAVGWGSAASSWLEGTVPLGPAAGDSLERLPGGALGSGQDTDDNAADFVERTDPDPQNLGAAPVPAASPVPSTTPDASSSATPSPPSTPTASPSPDPVISVAEARGAADGATVTIEGTALTGSDLADGGGFVADPSAGIAVLVSNGTYARGERLRVTGTLDDRYAQRTIRADGAGIAHLGEGSEPAAVAVTTGAIGESVEGTLVHTSGTLVGPSTTLSGAVAYLLDDGSGSVRVVVGDATGIDQRAWQAGTLLDLRGVVGQRDATGTGTSGYRLLPRDQPDVLGMDAGPSPSASGSPTPAPSIEPSDPGTSVISIAAARAAGKNASVTVRGVVTLPSVMFDPAGAALQDASGAIYLRLADEAGSLQSGQLVEVTGARSTWTGMESIRVSDPPTQLGPGSLPDPVVRTTAGVGEADEAALVIVTGMVSRAPQRTSAGTTYFDVDDGSGPLRVFLAPTLTETGGIVLGAELRIRGVVLQETTGQQPLRGYRLWPLAAADIEVVTPGGVTPATIAGGGGASVGQGSAAPAPGGERVVSVSSGPRPSLPEPRLALARPTPSPLGAMTVATGAGSDPGPTPRSALAAVALLAAATLLAAAAGGVAGPAALRRRMASLLHPAPDQDAVPEGAAAGEEDWPPAPPDLPRLVPLGVVTTAAQDAGEDDSRRDRGILPPT